MEEEQMNLEIVLKRQAQMVQKEYELKSSNLRLQTKAKLLEEVIRSTQRAQTTQATVRVETSSIMNQSRNCYDEVPTPELKPVKMDSPIKELNQVNISTNISAETTAKKPEGLLESSGNKELTKLVEENPVEELENTNTNEKGFSLVSMNELEPASDIKDEIKEQNTVQEEQTVEKGDLITIESTLPLPKTVDENNNNVATPTEITTPETKAEQQSPHTQQQLINQIEEIVANHEAILEDRSPQYVPEARADELVPNGTDEIVSVSSTQTSQKERKIAGKPVQNTNNNNNKASPSNNNNTAGQKNASKKGKTRTQQTNQ
jgi:hypothetical protein